MTPIDDLRAHLTALGRVVLGYSGGVDSALLAVAATEALGPARFRAVIGRSASYPAAQYAQAVALAERFGVPLLEVDTGELADQRYRANTPDRCYFCKSELWDVLHRVREELGFDVVVDGTNADDLGEHRPGLRAAGERAVRAPLAELGWTKAQVRAAAQALGVPQWDAPAAPCLASRVRYGVEVTEERLAQVEEAEAYLRALGVTGDLRVRHLGDGARIESRPEMHPLLTAHWDEVVARLQGAGFGRVELDPRGYRRGSLLVLDAGGAAR
ncbi:MAG TPA: ATP-dependent sacrificial sulfur transferase LarE [Gemmatimonadales bacterium]|nr:ATP-dependent sacrificial sulfur transferase LarE [Gemmatimonadales bacterium]